MQQRKAQQQTLAHMESLQQRLAREDGTLAAAYQQTSQETLPPNLVQSAQSFYSPVAFLHKQFINPHEFIQFCKDNLHTSYNVTSNKDLLHLCYANKGLDWTQLKVEGLSALQLHHGPEVTKLLDKIYAPVLQGRPRAQISKTDLVSVGTQTLLSAISKHKKLKLSLDQELQQTLIISNALSGRDRSRLTKIDTEKLLGSQEDFSKQSSMMNIKNKSQSPQRVQIELNSPNRNSDTTDKRSQFKHNAALQEGQNFALPANSPQFVLQNQQFNILNHTFNSQELLHDSPYNNYTSLGRPDAH